RAPMTTPPTRSPDRPAQAAGGESLIERFENAWHRGERPDLDDYLPAAPAERLPVLIELVHAEMEFRLKAGEAVRADAYLRRYSELTADAKVAAELIAREFALRRRGEPNLSSEDYLQRFPQFGGQLRDLLTATADTHASANSVNAADEP